MVGLGLYEFDHADGIMVFSGDGVNLGVGVEHFFNQQVALNLAGIYRFITYDEVEIGGTTYSADEDGDVFTLAVGLNLYFYIL